ncbi:MAG TPA: 50S ribosomal protein L32 [Bacteroidetes bacterium]|nr:50S ribosomal protein L32 [Bacteroidota bacterium]
MALPKRRASRQRRDKRRTHWKASAPSVTTCDNCHQPKLPHRACPNCGYYAGRSVFIPQGD